MGYVHTVLWRWRCLTTGTWVAWQARSLSLYALSIFYASRHTSLASSKSRRVSSVMRDVHRKASEKSIPSVWSNHWSRYAFDGNTLVHQITSDHFHVLPLLPMSNCVRLRPYCNAHHALLLGPFGSPPSVSRPAVPDLDS